MARMMVFAKVRGKSLHGIVQLGLLMIVSATGLATEAATIVLYNGQNSDSSIQTGNPPWAANTVGSGVTASAFERVVGTSPVGINTTGVDNNATNHPSAPNYRATSFTDLDNSAVDDGPGSPQQAAAVTNDAYLYFTVSATNPLAKLKLSSLTYNIGQGTGSTGQERGYAIYSSLDNYASALVADAMIDAVRPNWVNGNLPLGDALASSVTFRLYLFTGDGAGIGSNIDFDNFQVNGEVVPEPAGGLLALVSALLAVGMSRRRGSIAVNGQ